MKKIFILVLMVVFVISFSSLLEAKKKTYLVNMKLDKVTRMEKEEKEEKEARANSFDDGLIQIKWKPEPKKLKFELINKSSDFITIVWEECAFIDKDKEEHRVTHSDKKPWKSREEIPPQNIPFKGKLKSMVYPCDYFSQKVKFEARKDLSGRVTNPTQVIEWKKKPIFEKKVKLNEPNDFDFAGYKENLEKATFEVLLLIEIGGKRYKYHFNFKPEVKEK